MRRAGLEAVHAFANDPRIFPFVAQHERGPFDLSDVWGDVLALEFEGGIVLFHLGEPVEVHMLFLPRGGAIHAARQALVYLFATTDTREVIARIPDDLPHCRRAATACGFVRAGHTENEVLRDHGWVGVTHYTLTREQWNA